MIKNSIRLQHFFRFSLLFVFLGCGHEAFLLGPEFEFRQIAWNDLSDWEKQSVIGDWRKADVFRTAPFKRQSCGRRTIPHQR
ncbi:MAG TPA: hypothetical protein VGA99_12805 [bacterium]